MNRCVCGMCMVCVVCVGVCACVHSNPSVCLSAGVRLSGGHSLHETSSVLVETVTKSSKVGGAYSATSSSSLSSDASRVVCQGAGLSRAFIGQKNVFTVDCSKAGEELHGCRAALELWSPQEIPSGP